MKKQIDYSAILALFTEEPGSYRPWMEAPFRIDDKVYATDAHSMVIMSASFVSNVQELVDYKPENVLSVIPKYTTNIIGTIQVSELKEALAKIPMVDAEAECKCCQGEGEVEYSLEYNNRTYHTEADCPICGGEGVVTSKSGEKEYDRSSTIVIGKCHFLGPIIETILKACDLAGATEIKLLSQDSEHSTNVLSFNRIGVLVMPALVDKDREIEIIHTITL